MLLTALYAIPILIVISVLVRFFNRNIINSKKNVKTMIVLGSGTYPGEKKSMQGPLHCDSPFLFFYFITNKVIIIAPRMLMTMCRGPHSGNADAFRTLRFDKV
jgi:hypothetical protein